ncbi:MAG: energy-coupling factor transporter transmembrane protein EcfT [Clostridium sp.]|nr:energy-coupling factor transporter transmembrane protein EcfT [Clostridium sp.]
MDEFSKLHPIVNFIYFIFIIGFTMFCMHPVFLGISLISSLIYVIYLKGMYGIKNSLLVSLSIIIMVVLVNVIINNNGETIIFYIGNKPVFLEAIYYSVASFVMFFTVFICFFCYNEVMTSDKFIYLFGRRFPSLALIISMIFRLIPNMKIQADNIKNAQKAMGRELDKGSIKKKIQGGMQLISILITWALESSIETVDSMKSRGYDLSGRSSFKTYKFDTRDRICLSSILILIGIILVGIFKGESYISYFPSIVIEDRSFYSYFIYTAYFIFGNFPMIINIISNLLWKRYNKK